MAEATLLLEGAAVAEATLLRATCQACAPPRSLPARDLVVPVRRKFPAGRGDRWSGAVAI